jgi:hypothetical protein
MRRITKRRGADSSQNSHLYASKSASCRVCVNAMPVPREPQDQRHASQHRTLLAVRSGAQTSHMTSPQNLRHTVSQRRTQAQRGSCFTCSGGGVTTNEIPSCIHRNCHENRLAATSDHCVAQEHVGACAHDALLHVVEVLMLL